ncbi:hypothetical protein TrST_g1035 [Triparma strigata]|uniref:Uncharacterized protein n=1 Tax=Triparma strigata TaxID=1606541 RepID=A0A9W6ZSE9_9STRA|nr:hypothetical protein TrST_g1035 [Triparma strigata]
MSSFTSLPSPPNSTFIHDCSFDYYGRRLATCSGDRMLRIYTLTEDNEWILPPTSIFQAHEASTWRTSWSPPSYGLLLSTCSDDSTVCIWEEDSTSKKWLKKATLGESRKPVFCVEFGPQHVGLRLATGSADGIVRIYEAIDVLNLEHWPLSQRFDGCVEGELGVTCLGWCGSRFDGLMIVVGGSDGSLKVWKFSEASRSWKVHLDLLGFQERLLDVKWANGVGRGYHLIAAVGGGGVVRVYKFRRERGEEETVNEKDVHVHTLSTKSGSDVWRLGWNETGTVLATSGEGGSVNMWKASFEGEWKCVEEV